MLLNNPLGRVLFKKPPSFSYVTNVENLTNVAAYTFTSASIGPARADRVIGLITSANQIAGATHTSVTINGLNMFKCCESVPDFGADEPSVSIWSLPFPSGTTATFVVTFPDAGGHCDIGIYNLLGLTSHYPHGTDVGSLDGSTSRVTLNPPSRKGAIVLAGIDVYTENVTFTWDGGIVTQNVAIPYGGEAGAASYASGYSKGSGCLIDITPSGTASMAYAAASFY
jgi:hypothetical protein